MLSVFRYPLYFDTVLKYLPILISYALLCEVLGFSINEFESFQIIYKAQYSNYNAIIFNIFDIVFYLYFCYVFWKTFRKPVNKSLPKYGAVLFLVASLINPLVHDMLLYPQYYAILVGSIVLLACAGRYLMELKSGKKIPNHRNLMFWISTGILVFYSFYPIIMFIGLLNTELYAKLHIRTLHHMTIMVMYGSFIVGFLRMKGKLSKILN